MSVNWEAELSFFNTDPHIYLAPGVMPHWLGDGGSVTCGAAPTVFGGSFGFRLSHDPVAREVTITITQAPPGNPWYVYPCRFGPVGRVETNLGPLPQATGDVRLPAGTTQATIHDW